MSARSFIICLLAAFALGFGSAALMHDEGDAELGHNFKSSGGQGRLHPGGQVDSASSPSCSRRMREAMGLKQAPARAAKDTAQMAVVNEARAKAMQAAVDAEKAVMPTIPRST